MEPLRQALLNVHPKLPHIPLYSTVSGKQVNEIAYGADYWPQNIRQPVEFVAAINQILADGIRILLKLVHTQS